MHARTGALAFALALPFAFPAAAECPSGSPVLSGPQVVQVAQSYSFSWTPVLALTGTNDYYLLQRSERPDFTELVDEIRTTRPAETFPPATAASSSVLYHRVRVESYCPAAGPDPVFSNVVAVSVTTACDIPGSVGEITVTPAEPPAFAPYVLTWSSESGGPGPGGTPLNVSYHLRRTLPDGRVLDSISSLTKASFTDAPGEYVYEVREEAGCGTAGPWSLPRRVQVGSRPIASLAVVGQPRPIAAVAPTIAPSTRFTIRNTSTLDVTLTASAKNPAFRVTPSSFTVAPSQMQTLTVAYDSLAPTPSAVHTTVELVSGGASLSVPVDAAIGATAADGPVTWSDTDVDIDTTGGGVLRSIVNTGSKPAAFVTTVNKPWLFVETPDGSAWDGNLEGGESRLLRIRVDRARRQAETGTEIAAVSIVTAGRPDEAQVMQVVDDGPPLYVETGPRPDVAGERTRMIYAAVPNALDKNKVGRFSSDLWVANLDPVTPIDVVLLLTPVGTDSRNLTYRFTTRLQPSETRRYRNIVSKMLRADASCELEIRSLAPTLSVTALVNNTPLAALAPTSPRIRALGTTSSGTGQYGFEMRPTQPGEGVRVDDQKFVVTGLMHSAARRTNLLLTETSNAVTRVQIQVFDRSGLDITRGGAPIARSVPALGTIQVNDEDLFDPTVNYPGSIYAQVAFLNGTADAFGKVHGSVVPFATVIDQVTQDASLRVGVSVTALDPAGPPSASASRSLAASSLPFGGGAAPLLFPAAHLIGAPLGNGLLPYWRTRVTFTNTTDRRNGQDRAVLLSYIGSDQDPQAAPRTLRFSLPAGSTFTIDDILGSQLGFGIPESVGSFGPISFQVAADGEYTWKDVDVATETYTLDPGAPSVSAGQYATGMEGFSYHHGYSSFQSNLGTVQLEGAENSSRYRTNLILQEVGGGYCNVAISAYLNGSFVPIATKTWPLPPFGYLSDELFRGWLGLDLSEMTDVRVVVRQVDGEGVFMAFASKINLVTGDPANVFLRPALAGTGR